MARILSRPVRATATFFRIGAVFMVLPFRQYRNSGTGILWSAEVHFRSLKRHSKCRTPESPAHWFTILGRGRLPFAARGIRVRRWRHGQYNATSASKLESEPFSGWLGLVAAFSSQSSPGRGPGGGACRVRPRRQADPVRQLFHVPWPRRTAAPGRPEVGYP